MSKKFLSRIFYGTFILVFIIMVGIMVWGLIDEKRDEKAQTARYQSMITEGSKVELTDEILNEDFDKYIQDSVKAKKTFISLLVCFFSVMILFVVMYIFNIILKGMEEGANSSGFVIMLALFLAVMFMFGTFGFVAVRMIVPALLRSNPEEEKAFFTTLNIKDAERIEEREEVKTSDGYETRVHVYYHLIDEDGNVISVNKVLYERYIGEGVYYAGMSSSGKVFSVYPDKYFTLPQ